jgi:hypothetical protein
MLPGTARELLPGMFVVAQQGGKNLNFIDRPIAVTFYVQKATERVTMKQ